jgi:hypothetical protein
LWPHRHDDTVLKSFGFGVFGLGVLTKKNSQEFFIKAFCSLDGYLSPSGGQEGAGLVCRNGEDPPAPAGVLEDTLPAPGGLHVSVWLCVPSCFLPGWITLPQNVHIWGNSGVMGLFHLGEVLFPTTPGAGMISSPAARQSVLSRFQPQG